MSSKQGDNRNRINAQKICFYSLLSAASMVVSYLESLLSLAFIAPGIKLGLANAVVLLLVMRRDIKGAFLVNIVRVLLSSLLFGSAISLAFSLAAGIASIIVSAVFVEFKSISAVGVSVLGGVTHNVVQCVVAVVITGAAVLYYLPVLIVAGVISGVLVGVVSQILFKKVKTNVKI